MEIRQEAKIRDIERLEMDLDSYIDDPENDVREKHVRIQRYRTRALSRQWEAARLNKRYQEKTQETTINIDHADLRARAWEQSQLSKAKEIPHEEIENTQQ